VIGMGIGLGGLLVAGLVLTWQALGTTAQPEPTRFTPGTPSARTSTIPNLLATPRVGRSLVTLQVPFEAVIPSREYSADDGHSLFLAGDGAVARIDPQTGRMTLLGGGHFPTRPRTWLYDHGLWLSTVLSDSPYCGPACWGVATTYRVDPSTGEVTATLASTYLIGSSPDGIWVASAGAIKRLDPSTGQLLSSMRWTASGEPRFGCASLWSFSQDDQHTYLARVDPTTGIASEPTSLDLLITYGPIAVEGQCWAMTGSGGASKRPTEIIWLNPDGSVFDTRFYEEPIVLLDAEFWIYRTDGTLQRLEPSSGATIGPRFDLAIRPPQGDPTGLFSALGSLWLYEGDQLVGFDVPTGAAAAND
jgi:hypothetical protein